MSIVSVFSCIVCFLLFFSVGNAGAQDVYLCVWRNPERTMSKIFPQAKDYTTVNKSITPAQLADIEKSAGTILLPGQRDKFQYFRMWGGEGREIGTIIAASQKGTYGAIEFVVGFDTSGIIQDLYIQRSRERDTMFRERSFLDLFKGKSVGDYRKYPGYYTGEQSAGTSAVINGLIKEIVTYVTLKGADH